MPTAEDIIFCLTASVTEARAKLDAQTAKLAQAYLEDDLLRHFSVPRMRVGDITMNVPIAIDSIASGTDIDVIETSEDVLQTIFTGYNIQAADVDTSTTNELRVKIRDRVQDLQSQVQLTQNLNDLPEYANLIAEESMHILREKGWGEHTEGVELSVISFAIVETLRKRFIIDDPCKVNVIAEAAKLKDIAPQSIVNLKIQIIEDGMTWAISERKEGDEMVIETKLIPE